MSDKITPSEAAKRDVAEVIEVHGGPIAAKASELLRDVVNVLPAPPEAELLARIEALEAENARLRAALEPFIAGCFYDNGDLTISQVPNTTDHIKAAWMAHRFCK